MIPVLARPGRYLLATAAIFLVTGALYTAPPLVALGGLIISALLTCYLAYFPRAVLLRRHKVELSWWIPPGDQPGGALSVERPFSVQIALRNHGPRRQRVLSIQIFGSSALELPRGLEAVVPAGHQVELRGEARARAAGHQVLHGAVLRFGDVLGLFEMRAFFPNPLAVKVFPRRAGLAGPPRLVARGGAAAERAGAHFIRRRGLAGELREIRDHAPGDPFKFIAWKATARRQRLMVRDLETEVVATYQLLVDIGGTMRSSVPGQSKLDYAVETAAALARAALSAGDRVGLVGFDSRIYSQLRPGSGHHHFLKLIDRLIETHHVIDEDLTAVTNGELVAAVADYLVHQEAVDARVRRAPSLDDPAWAGIQTGPGGELYNLRMLGTVVETALRSADRRDGGAGVPAWWWSHVHIDANTDPIIARLRLFCRLRGIELPYRTQHEPGRRAHGLSEALERASSGPRADALVIISDMGGVLEDPDRVLKALARTRHGGRKVVAVVPVDPALSRTPATDIAARVADVLRDDEARRLAEARRLLARHGIPAVVGTPDRSPLALLGGAPRARAPLRRAS